MDRALFVSSDSASQTMVAMQTHVNNLANASTYGFLADEVNFTSEPIEGDTYPSRVYTKLELPSIDFTHGSPIETGRDLDVAIHGEGWIAIQTPEGRESYTRAGNLQISSEGLLQTARGDLVLGNQGPISIPPSEKTNIGRDGSITIQPLGLGIEAQTEIDRIKLVNPDHSNLVKGEDGLIYLKEDDQAMVDDKVLLISGSLESSNVNGVNALVKMMDLNRYFEQQIKLMKVLEEDADKSAQILQVE